MSVEKFYNNEPEARPGYVYDETYGVYDLVDERPVQPQVILTETQEKPNRRKMPTALKALGSLVLATALSYGAVHTGGDFMARKSASLGTADVKPGDLWNDFVNDLPERIKKGF
jgi:hypothetical protein